MPFENEQFTESLTRKLMHFDIGQNDGFYVYAQHIDNNLSIIKNCLKRAGAKPNSCPLDEYKINNKGIARPEFIITFEHDSSSIIVIECKKSKKEHMSSSLDKVQKYAVDGVLYYAKYLKDEFNVIALAISGTKEDDFLANAYYFKKGSTKYKELSKCNNILLTPLNYLDLVEEKRLSRKFSLHEIKSLAKTYNTLMHEKLQIQMQERIMFIASCLLALCDDFFLKTYALNSNNEALIESIIMHVKNVLYKYNLDKDKITQILNEVKLIKSHQKLIALKAEEDGSLMYFLKQLDLFIIPMIQDKDAHQDALGIFYHEFIKYTANNTANELGIVLTPEHLCDFMCELANINLHDTVIDICCGTGSFLISALKHLSDKAHNIDEINAIKNNKIYGIELQARIYSIAITNMILRGNRAINIVNSDCFKYRAKDNVSFSVGLLNPPYSQKNNVELKFVKKMLDLLSVRGRGVVVVPMSCAIGTKFKEERKELLKNHTLKAVFSMGDELFSPVNTHVCIMVWEAHIAHDENTQTFFAYFHDDGFVKKKNLGRVDAFNRWESIKKEYLSMYRNNKVVLGKSTLQSVSYNDEWLCEAYMETDYSSLSKADFIKTVKDFLAYKITVDNDAR